MARSLAERLRVHEQQKARLAEQEAKLKDAGRKARTRRLIEAGGLVEKVGLLGLEPNALYGALLSLRDGSSNAKQVEQWAALGGRTFLREQRARDEGKEPVVLSFPNALPKDATAPLRAAGLRFNKVFQHWEGLVLVAALLLVGRLPAHAASPASPQSGHIFVVLGGLLLLFVGLRVRRTVGRLGFKGMLETVLRVLAVPATWALVVEGHRLFGIPPASLIVPLWLALVVLVFKLGGGLVPRPVRDAWASLFTAPERDTHGTARFGTARNAGRHLAPAAPADAFVLGVLRDARGDRRFRQEGSPHDLFETAR